MKKATKNLGPKDRIIEKALTLFYTQGYLDTGINQIIKEAGVSKASFYDHFKSKDDLCLVYLRENSSAWSGELKEKINEFKKPLDRFFAPFDFFEDWLPECQFRGCALLNMASEIADPSSSIRKEVIYAQDGFRSILRQLTKDLKKSENKFKDLDVESITNDYYVLAEGAITTCQIYGEIWPLKSARGALKKIISKNP